MDRKRFELWDPARKVVVDRNVGMGAFAKENDLEPHELNEIGAMEIGDERPFFTMSQIDRSPFFVLRRVA